MAKRVVLSKEESKKIAKECVKQAKLYNYAIKTKKRSK